MIDINCDVGEGLDNEHVLMPLISSCNIACGGHAGSVKIMDKVMQLAIEHDVKIGAHPSFPDRENFGRIVMNISDKDLKESIQNQLQLFKERAQFNQVKVHHVKPHGALYNLIAADREKAVLVLEAIQKVFPKVNVYVPYDSEIERVAVSKGVPVIYEAFADRNYTDALKLVSRSEPNALLTDPQLVVAHVKRMALNSRVLTVSGKEKEIKAATFCVHGDNKNALLILKELHQHLEIR